MSKDDPRNSVTYPQYRRYKNGKSYFKINSREHFVELKSQPGGKWLTVDFEARILPDRNLISDMLFDYEEFWEDISASDFEAVLKQQD